MILVEHFHRMLDKTDVGEFRRSLTLWYRLVREAGVAPFKRLARLIKKYRNYIESYVTSKLTTAKSVQVQSANFKSPRLIIPAVH